MDRAKIDLTGAQVEELLKITAIQQLLRDHQITKLRLSLRTELDPGSFQVTLQPPNKASFDRRLGGPIIQDFLLTRGFLMLDPTVGEGFEE